MKAYKIKIYCNKKVLFECTRIFSNTKDLKRTAQALADGAYLALNKSDNDIRYILYEVTKNKEYKPIILL